MDLLQAAGRGDLGRLKELLDAGCDPNLAHSISGNTALYNACFLDSVEVVKLLLSRGANPNHRMTYRSPVDGGVERGLVALMVTRSEPVTSALLDAGARS